MAIQDDTTRFGVCETRRALIAALAGAPIVGAPAPADALYAALPAPEPRSWAKARSFISWLDRSGAAAVTAAEGALADPEDCQGVVIGGDGVLRILLPGGVAVSQHGVEAYA